jgi:hypothetical protein
MKFNKVQLKFILVISKSSLETISKNNTFKLKSVRLAGIYIFWLNFTVIKPFADIETIDAVTFDFYYYVTILTFPLSTFITVLFTSIKS